VHRALVAAAAELCGPAAPTSTIGIDETRARSVHWMLGEAGWRRTDPWMTSIVDLDPTHPGGIIGLAPGRSGGCVAGWIALQNTAFREAVQLVAIDPSAPYASGIRRALPTARSVVDHWHLQREVSARESHGGEGRIRAARFPARKSLEEFDFDHARGLKRDTVAHLRTLDFVTARENVVFPARPAPARRIWPSGWPSAPTRWPAKEWCHWPEPRGESADRPPGFLLSMSREICCPPNRRSCCPLTALQRRVTAPEGLTYTTRRNTTRARARNRSWDTPPPADARVCASQGFRQDLPASIRVAIRHGLSGRDNG